MAFVTAVMEVTNHRESVQIVVWKKEKQSYMYVQLCIHAYMMHPCSSMFLLPFPDSFPSTGTEGCH